MPTAVTEHSRRSEQGLLLALSGEEREALRAVLEHEVGLVRVCAACGCESPNPERDELVFGVLSRIRT
jgi:hypothetical protein